MTTLPPAKLKAHLGQLKESVIDSDSCEIERCYLALVAAEMVQRGVLADAEDAVKLWEAVRATAGRALLDTSSSLPKSLLAASSAMAGMVAEKLAAFIEPTIEGATANFEANEYRKNALRRCQEVDDNRLVSLLQVQTRKQLRFIAEGYFLRAASFQPDPPQMWKKSLDAIVARQELSGTTSEGTEPWESALPLSKLIEIAERKGNSKRVSELSLRLAESYLSTPEVVDSKEDRAFVDSFIHPFRPGVQKISSGDATKAREAIEKSNVELLQDEESLMWHKLILLRIEWEGEQALINQVVDDIQLAAKNRGSSITKDNCQRKAALKVWQQSFAENMLDATACNLRDAVLSNWIVSAEEKKRHSKASMELLLQQANRLVDRAQAMAVASQTKKPSNSREDADSAWTCVISFVSSVLSRIDSCLEKDPSSKTPAEDVMSSLSRSCFAMVEACLIAASTSLWMICSRGISDENMTLQRISLASDLLAAAIKIERDRKRESNEEKAVKSTLDEGSSFVIELECAYATTLTLAEMGHLDGHRSPRARQAIEKAISMSEKAEKYTLYQGKFGSFYLQSLFAWSGLHMKAFNFCSASQARSLIRLARDTLHTASTEWGRRNASLEYMLIDLAEGDAEGGLLNGGFIAEAKKIFDSAIQPLNGRPLDDDVETLLKAHSSCGLARAELLGSVSEDLESIESISRRVLATLKSWKAKDKSGSLYNWRSKAMLKAVSSYDINIARQLVADCLIRRGNAQAAEEFLESAFRDSPEDFETALALGAFRLRMALYEPQNEESTPGQEKAAQVQLLKAAKLNSNQAIPFALLGVWYEERKDIKRAIGCYSKALMIDSANPVAGRGILRLRHCSEARKVCETAADVNSNQNGWAWLAIGRQKSMVEDNDELAAVCFQKALRCRDIESLQNEPLSIFFETPAAYQKSMEKPGEVVTVWTELAEAYRRLGRYSAAVRAFDSAWNLAGEALPSMTICSWAQVELDLGLLEDAAEKFGLVMARGDALRSIAAYGQGSALLALAKRDVNDGKHGYAFQLLRRGVRGLQGSWSDDEEKPRCSLKLLGDLYSFGAMLPPEVFIEDLESKAGDISMRDLLLRSQLSFVGSGEDAYAAAERNLLKSDGEDDVLVRAALLCDLGSNLLLQAHILTYSHSHEEGGRSIEEVATMVKEVRDRYDRSADAFQRAIDAEPTYSPAWCGLGCARCFVEPLLAQHSFGVSLKIENSFADSLANLAFLYASHGEAAASDVMLDALTQAADSPMMWIGRAILLENNALREDPGTTDALISQSADSYRAALQVLKHPVALLGLSLTSCLEAENEGYLSPFESLSREVSRMEGSACVAEYRGITSGTETSFSPEVFSVRTDPNSPSESLFVTELTQARQIVHHPEDCNLWLHMAKSLAQEIYAVSESKNWKLVRQTVEAAALACDKAASLLLHQAMQPILIKPPRQEMTDANEPVSLKRAGSSQGPVPQIVSAENVSEALSLSYWTHKVKRESEKDPKEGQRETFDLAVQRSLWLCPDNSFARRAVSNF